jgi:spermidine synthase
MFESSDARVAATAGGGSPARLSWIVAFFVLSGLTGLVYQSVWTQYLGLVLGSAAYAQSLVLAIFMGGMAIGSWIASRRAERMGNLLYGYGAIEGAVGVFALVFHPLFVAGTALLYDRLIPGIENPLAIDLVRWGFAALMILPQTILLGMTFPIMSAGLMRWLPERAGAILGGLYFLNSAGAAIGALASTFLLVPALGLPGTLVFAGLVNLLIFACVVVARFPARAARADGVAAAAAQGQASAQLPLLSRVMLVGAALTGLSSFMYEIGWVRMLSLALGSSLHAFELMLAAFIGGLALGALYVRRKLDGVSDALRFVGWVQVLMGCAALATLPLYDYAFGWVGTIVATLAPSAAGYTLYNVASAAISIAIMLPAAFFAGTTLPAMTYVLLRNGAGERVMGQMYSANTLGAIVGVVLMMHWALPALGLKYSMVVAAAIDIVVGLAVFALAKPRMRLVPALALSAVAIVGAIVLADFDPRRMNAGVFRTGLVEIDHERQILFAKDGKTASVALFGVPGKNATLSTNGKPDASMSLVDSEPMSRDEPTMILIGLLGLAYGQGAMDVANIGFGSGLTTHTFAASSAPRSITTVEIEPVMIEAARGFGERVAFAYDDPRSRIVIDDARAYFSGRHARYDVIASEPSNPWVSGVARLFSTEFYRFAQRHLAPGGVFVQWVQTYEMSDATLLSLLRALDASFADYAVYLSHAGDMVVVASADGPLRAPSTRFLDEPRTRELARRAGIASAVDLEDRRIADRRVMRALLAQDDGPANSDFRPVLAHWAPRDRFMKQQPDFVTTVYDSPLGLFSFAGLYTRNRPDAWRTPPVAQPVVDERRYAEDVAAGLRGKPAVGGTDTDLVWHGIGLRARELGATCFAGVETKTATQVLVRAFQQTTPYLAEHDLAELWSRRDWLACGAGAPAAIVDLANLFDALVRRDGPALASRAQAYHDTHLDALDPDRRVEVVYAGLFAAFLNRDAPARDRWLERAQRMDLSARARFRLGFVARVLDDVAASATGTNERDVVRR